MALEFHKTTAFDIRRGNFPLNHDCIVKLEYFHDCGLSCDYFTCRSCDSGLLVDIVSKLSLVHYVKISSLDDFSLRPMKCV